jgi:hypothetical protein
VTALEAWLEAAVSVKGLYFDAFSIGGPSGWGISD